MNTYASNKFHRTAVSIFVIVILGTQAATIPVTATHGTYVGDRLFPVLEYPMYAPAHYEGERITASWLIEGVLADGQTIDISKEILQIDIFDFVRIVQATLAGNANATQTLETLIRTHVPGARAIRDIRIENYPMRLTRDGPTAMPSEVVKTIPMPQS